MSYTITDEQIDDAVAALDELNGGDKERDHGDADDIMVALLPPEVRDARARAVNRARGWWYA